MNNGTIYHNIFTLADTGSSEWILSGTDKTPLNIYQNVRGTLGIIKEMTEKLYKELYISKSPQKTLEDNGYGRGFNGCLRVVDV